jgi:hypothetical protein
VRAAWTSNSELARVGSEARHLECLWNSGSWLRHFIGADLGFDIKNKHRLLQQFLDSGGLSWSFRRDELLAPVSLSLF